ncbi:class II aldolase/adducin family protein [Bacillus sp. REN16]|uniref:class II aldolase/adducin family protein n=1 Tax=Bacillus sp. REN16 TaxID=2887296 RepID=UPI001E45D54F|nr:class II aldolase/adducin family protein [Bacillus sp. REN16]MCC3355930.1 class II aldolase/adducin family protein [Bacillus sp. REN16]
MKYVLDSRLARDLQYYSKKVVRNNLVVGPGGNNSVRDDEIMWISPSGFALDDISNEQWVPVNITSGEILSSLKPSSELSMHLEIYRQRQDVLSIVHTHPPITIGIISTEHNIIPPMFPDFVALVGDVPFIDYVVPCSDELAEAVIEVLKDPTYNALYLKNHGLITVGTNIKQAYYRTEIIEDAARVFWVSKTVGVPQILSKQEQNKILNLEAEQYRQKLLDRS